MAILSKKEQQVLDSQREIAWLKRQIKQYEEENQAEEAVIPESATLENVQDSLNVYREHVNKMKSELDVYVQYNKSKEEATKAVDEQHFTLDALYPAPSDHHKMKVKKATEDLINKRDKMTTQILKLLEEYNQHKLELTQLQKDIIQQHITNRQLLKDIHTLKENPTTETEGPLADLRQSIKEQKDYISTIRGVLNGLILESGVDWMNDEHLFSVITRIGEPIQQ